MPYATCTDFGTFPCRIDLDQPGPGQSRHMARYGGHLQSGGDLVARSTAPALCQIVENPARRAGDLRPPRVVFRAHQAHYH